jgi:hypothetical protein
VTPWHQSQVGDIGTYPAAPRLIPTLTFSGVPDFILISPDIVPYFFTCLSSQMSYCLKADTVL